MIFEVLKEELLQIVVKKKLVTAVNSRSFIVAKRIVIVTEFTQNDPEK